MDTAVKRQYCLLQEAEGYTASEERRQKYTDDTCSKQYPTGLRPVLLRRYDHASLRLVLGCHCVSLSCWRGCCSGHDVQLNGHVQLRCRQATCRRISARSSEPEETTSGPRNSLRQSLGAGRKADDALYQHADRGRRKTACGRRLYDVL